MSDFGHNSLIAETAAGAAAVLWDQGPAALVAAAIRAGEGELSAHGALAVTTGAFTGRSVRDKFIVVDDLTRSRVWWDNSAPLRQDQFDLLLADFQAFARDRRLYGQHLAAGADPRHALAVTVLSETAWHALFIRNLLRQPDPAVDAPALSIIHLPGFRADPPRHGTNSETVIAIDMSRRVVLIGGTAYAGEIKKSVFSVFNFLAPLAGVLPMHCSANIGAGGDVALFFGLSGTGKTTLSNDPDRLLIGDDEHGWSEQGVFNLEGGCYAKTARLSAAAEPEIYAATRRFGTVLENLRLDAAGEPLYDDITLTENTRAAYPLATLPAVAAGGVGGVPQTVVFLTADAFGVLPPVARLTPEQASFHFLSGYTAKVAGTERGVNEPVATFSTCFGAPFMPLHPRVYGRLFENRLRQSGASVYLLNTGWSGGGYGVGDRIAIATTRTLLAAILSRELYGAPTRCDPVFGLNVPLAVSGVDAAVLDPRRCWADPLAYDAAAARLKKAFEENFRKFGTDERAAAE